MAPQRRRPRPTIVILALLSLTVLTLDFRDVAVVKTVRHAAADVLSPFQGAADWVATPFENAWHGITDYPDLAEENEELEARIAELEGEIAEQENAEELIPRLEELLDTADIEWVGDIPTTLAQVVQQPANAFAHTLTIDKGSDDGIAVGMPVVTPAGLAGTVIDVDGGRSTIRLLSDPEFRVGVRLVDNQRFGVSTGRGIGRSLSVDTGIEPDSDDGDIEEGALVTTSGIDDRSPFPAMIPVGRVTDVGTANGGLNVSLDVEPVVDLESLAYVNVLLYEPIG